MDDVVGANRDLDQFGVSPKVRPRAKQGRGEKRAGSGSILQPPRRTSRPNFRNPTLPRQRTKLGGARDHIVEHDVSRARSQCTASTWDRLPRCAPSSRLSDWLGAYQSDWGLHLAKQPPRRSRSIETLAASRCADYGQRSGFVRLSVRLFPFGVVSPFRSELVKRHTGIMFH